MHANSITPSEIEEVFLLQRRNALLLRKEPLQNRKERLQKLRKWIHKNRKAIHKAVHLDFQKHPQEVDAIEIFHVLNEIRLALKNLDTWASPKKIDAPITMLGTRSSIYYEPKGVCLIMSPWNYPFSLAVGPMVSAIAAGNTVILKPSEMTPNVSTLLRSMVTELFEPEKAKVFEGDALVAEALLNFPFDHIFFTGSPLIGKVVMKAASAHLSSVTLELGGKSPVIVDSDANIKEAAERIAVAKFVNNGQTCVAPDYVLIDEKVKDKFTKALVEKTDKMFSAAGGLENSSFYCRIVNDKHYRRLTELVEDARTKGARVIWAGHNNPLTRFFHPVVLSDLPENAKLLEDEIFGPVLPIIPFKTIEEAIAFVNGKPKPLSLYIFSNKSETHRNILLNTSAGGVCINDCGIHFLHHDLPFGGINHSGIGKSHGHYGFIAFSNEKAVLKQKTGYTTVKPFYPPYTTFKGKIMDWFLRFF